MASSVTSASGLASGIDTKALIDQLIYAERASARVIEARKATTQKRLDAVKAFNTKMLALRDALDPLKQSETFGQRKATSGNESALAVSATTSAQLNSYSISVKNLAAAHQVASNGNVADAASSLGASGSVFLQVGTGALKEVTLTDRSLNGIAAAINATADIGVKASVVNDGTRQRLLVQSSQSGTANAITAFYGSGDLVDDFGDSGVGYDSIALANRLDTVVAASNAQIRVGDPVSGLLIERSSNTISDAFTGVTLTLKAKADSIAVDVAQDNSGTKAKIKAAVDALNAARTYLSDNSKYDATTKVGGPLIADSDLRNALDRVDGLLNQTVTGQATGYASLADIGISLDSTGKLAIDDAKLDARLNADPAAMRSLFAKTAGDAYTELFKLTDSTNGTVGSKATGIEATITSMAEQITRIDTRLEARKARYQKQFLAMEQSIQKLNSQGSYISGLTAQLNKSSS